jgi:hypothetical protein
LVATFFAFNGAAAGLVEPATFFACDEAGLDPSSSIFLDFASSLRIFKNIQIIRKIFK